MPISSNKFNSFSRKRQAGPKSVNNSSDVAILSMAVNCQSRFRRVPRSLPRRENERNGNVFQALLSEGNRELASLLRDVRTVKTVQELMRHASSRLTLDVYAQALTPAKRAAHLKLVGLIQPAAEQQLVPYGPTVKMQSL